MVSHRFKSSLKANTLRSREQIRLLVTQVKALQDALATVKPSHPLLTNGDDLSAIESTGKESDTMIEEPVDILGTLSIAGTGSTIFPFATSMAEVRRANTKLDRGITQ